VGRAVDDLLDTLRQIAPVDDLLAPVAPLLRDAGLIGPAGLLDELPGLVAVASPHGTTPAPPAGGLLGKTAPSAVPPSVLAQSPAVTAPHSFQTASARPPAAEVGGRPVSLPPRTAPAPAAGGATALPFSSSSAGGFFVPFLALLVLAALAMPRLMRRLDGLPALVRPEPFLCALERPG
jgi:hypothetical protein